MNDEKFSFDLPKTFYSCGTVELKRKNPLSEYKLAEIDNDLLYALRIFLINPEQSKKIGDQ